MNGTQLQKGHGKIIDESRITDVWLPNTNQKIRNLIIQEQRTEGDLTMNNNTGIKYTLEELNKLALQRDNTLSRIENMKKQYSDNKLIVYILETIEKDLQ